MTGWEPRKQPIHQAIRTPVSQPVIVFLTVCTQHRKKVLARDEAHQAILSAWRLADHWVVGRYVVMPDHVHLFCAPATEESLDLKRWMIYWRSMASRSWPDPKDQPLWQRDYWDTQLRSCQSYDEKWEYVRNNPVRHGLVGSAADWPYAGELAALEW